MGNVEDSGESGNRRIIALYDSSSRDDSGRLEVHLRLADGPVTASIDKDWGAWATSIPKATACRRPKRFRHARSRSKIWKKIAFEAANTAQKAPCPARAQLIDEAKSFCRRYCHRSCQGRTADRSCRCIILFDGMFLPNWEAFSNLTREAPAESPWSRHSIGSQTRGHHDKDLVVLPACRARMRGLERQCGKPASYCKHGRRL